MESFPQWEQGIRREYPPLRGETQADVAIVGGGLTGVSCAAMLSALGAKVVLLEARRLGMGATWCCTGKVTAQIGGVYQTIVQQAGMAAAANVAWLLREAVLGVKELCSRLGVPTQEQSVYVFAETTDDLPALHALSRLEARLGLPVHQALDAGGCPFPVELSLAMERQLLLSPLAYLLALADFAQGQGCCIYEHTPVRGVDGQRLTTGQGSVRGTHIILATGCPGGCTALPLLAGMQQRVWQTVTLMGQPPILNSHLSVQPDEMSLRPIPGGALLSWDLGRVGSRQQIRTLLLQRTWGALLPDMQVTERHIRQEVYSSDGLPLIGPMHPGQSHLLMATGYSGWGVTGSYLAAKVLAGYITGHPMPHARLFRPDRPLPRANEGLHMAAAYLGGLSHRSAPVCPHMGGRLRYDVENRQWVCPCHGSAFTTMGEMLNAPALTDAKVSAKQR